MILAYYIFLNSNEQNIIPKLKNFLESLSKEGLDNRKWLIFVAHEPLYSLKFKKKNGKIKDLQSLSPN